SEGAPTELPPLPAAIGGSRRNHLHERLQGGAAAVVLLVAVFLLLGGNQALSPPRAPAAPVAPAAPAAATTHLGKAFAILQTLVASIGQESPREIATSVRALMAERAAVVAAGGDVSILDAAIRSQVPSLLFTLP